MLIHEATHKFAATKDVAYGITNNLKRIQQLKREGLQTASTAGVMSNADGLANAESYAAFAICVE